MDLDLSFFRDVTTEETTPSQERRHREAAPDAIARIALDTALAPALRRRIARDPCHVLVVEVPGADWVDAVRTACEGLRSWHVVFARTGASRSEDVPSRGNDKVAKALASGGGVLGVSQAPDTYLPSSLAAADTRVTIAAPDNALIAKVLRAVTGRAVTGMPERVAAGLTFWDLAASIRGTPKASLERLVAAAQAKSLVDPAVVSAPPFASLRGYGPAHKWGTRLLQDIEDWRRDDILHPFHLIDRNAVLASDPGLGKSTYVRALAKSARLPLIISSVSSWFTSSNGYLDGVLKHIDTVFDQALHSSPSILFLDEIDSIPDRKNLDSRSSSWWTPVCTHVLLKIDRLNTDPHAKVCLIGATNFAARLDAALIRPGRLTRVITIERPDVDAIAAIARQHLGDELPETDLRPLAELGLGATGAEVAGWVKEARSKARAQGRRLTLDDLAGIVAPPDTRPEDVRRRGAVHEAAHAVGASAVGAAEVCQVDILPRRESGGSTTMRSLLPATPLRQDLECLVVSILCGRAAEVVFYGEACGGAGGSADSDLGRATAILAGVHGSLGLGQGLAYLGDFTEAALLARHDTALRSAIESDLRRLHAEAERLVTRYRDVIEDIAGRLLRHRIVAGEDVRALVAKADRGRHH